jgi:hypothetical protein
MVKVTRPNNSSRAKATVWYILLALGVLGNSIFLLLKYQGGSGIGLSTNATITASLASPNHYLEFMQGTPKQQQQQQQRAGSSKKKAKKRRKKTLDAIPNDSSIQNPPTSDISNFTNIDKDAFSFCLLIKDDNDIMNEWIAYHYYTLKLRTMIVSIDPDSKTTPEPLLQVWHDNFDLHYEIWDDSKYMPGWFLRGEYEKVPRMIKWQDKNASKWYEEGADVSVEQRQQAVLEINKHRYRQAKFLQHCAKYLQDNQFTWVTHIDTDEYIVVNPTFRQKKKKKQKDKHVMLEKRNTVYNHLIDMKDSGKPVNWPCISMPRVLYGSVEDSNDTSSNIASKFESLRWKYHTAYHNDALNKQPKAIMDVSGFPPFDESKKAFSIHRPSIHLCRMQGQMNVRDWRRYPLTINHYLGSLERYQAREDTRRTVTVRKHNWHEYCMAGCCYMGVLNSPTLTFSFSTIYRHTSRRHWSVMPRMIIGLMPGGPAFWNYMEERWYPKSWDDIWTVIAITSRVPWKVYGMGPQI